jgi:hypothetical protein
MSRSEHLSRFVRSTLALARPHDGRRKGRILAWGSVDGELIENWAFDRPDYGIYAGLGGKDQELAGYRIEELAQLSALPAWRRRLHNLLIRTGR